MQCFYFLWICISVRFVHLWATKAVSVVFVLPYGNSISPGRKSSRLIRKQCWHWLVASAFRTRTTGFWASQVKGKEKHLNSWLLNWTGLWANLLRGFVLFCWGLVHWFVCFVCLFFLRLAMTACQDFGRQMNRKTCMHPTILWVPGCAASPLQHEDDGSRSVYNHIPQLSFYCSPCWARWNAQCYTLFHSSYCLCSNYIHALCKISIRPGDSPLLGSSLTSPPLYSAFPLS